MGHPLGCILYMHPTQQYWHLELLFSQKFTQKNFANLGPTSLSKEENEGEYLKIISTIKVNVCQQYKQTKT